MPAAEGPEVLRSRCTLLLLASRRTGAAKKAKEDDPDKEIAGCAACRTLAAADKPGGSDKQYCKIHRTKGHDLQNCRQVELLAEKQKAEYERRDKEEGPGRCQGIRQEAWRPRRPPRQGQPAREARPGLWQEAGR